MLSVQSWPDIFDKDVTERIVDGIGEMPAFWRDYFNVEPTVDLYTQTAGYSGFGRMGAWKDGEDLPLDAPADQFDSKITQEFFGLGFVVSRKMVKYGQSRHVARWADALVLSLADLYGYKHALVLNNAFTTTYTSLGTKALIANNHIASGSATRSNILASSALTPANLETLIVQGLNMTDYRGKRAMLRYTKLIVPPSLRRTAVKILQSEGESGTTDNDINTQKGMFRPVVDPFLDGSLTHWFLQAENHGMTSLHGMAPTPKRYVSESDEKLVHGLAADFAVGVEYFEGIAGSQGA